VARRATEWHAFAVPARPREHVPPVLHAVELPISRKRSDHRAAVEALAL